VKEYLLKDADGTVVIGRKITKDEVGVETDRFEYDPKTEYWTIKDGTKVFGMEWQIVLPRQQYEFIGEA